MPGKPPDLVDKGPMLAETGLVHSVLEPLGPGPFKTVVMLHGRYGSEEVMWIFGKSTPVNWLKIAPRGLVADAGGSFSWITQEYGVWPDLTAFDPAAAAVAHFLGALPRVYNADPEQIFLMGFSQGAAVSYATALRHPGISAAIAGLVGFLPENCAQGADLAALRDLPVFMSVGREDKLVPYARSLATAATLRRAEAQLAYHEYDTGHKLNRQGMDDLQQWWRGR